MASPQGQSFDLSSPAAQRMLGDRGTPLAAGKKQLMQVAGDADGGVQSRIQLDVGKHEVLVLAKQGDVPLLTVDIYAVPGEPVKVHLLCPRCRNNLEIKAEKKAIEFEPRAANRRSSEIRALGLSPEMHQLAAFGDLSIETFECTWELDAKLKVSSFSGNLCRYRAAIDHNLLTQTR